MKGLLIIFIDKELISVIADNTETVPELEEPAPYSAVSPALLAVIELQQGAVTWN